MEDAKQVKAKRLEQCISVVDVKELELHLEILAVIVIVIVIVVAGDLLVVVSSDEQAFCDGNNKNKLSHITTT